MSEARVLSRTSRRAIAFRRARNTSLRAHVHGFHSAARIRVPPFLKISELRSSFISPAGYDLVFVASSQHRPGTITGAFSKEIMEPRTFRNRFAGCLLRSKQKSTKSSLGGSRAGVLNQFQGSRGYEYVK